MAKPLSSKSKVIRDALAADPAKGSADHASAINGAAERSGDRIKVTSQDVANQRTVMHKMGTLPVPKRGRKKSAAKARAKTGKAPAAASTTQAWPPGTGGVAVVGLIDRVFELADECGGLGELRRLVDKLSGARA